MTKDLTLPVVADALMARQQVAAQAESLLRASPYLPIQKLKCEYNEGVLTIRGPVPTFYLKQLAQTRIQGLPRVEEINNRVEVVWAHRTFVASACAVPALEASGLNRSHWSDFQKRRTAC